MVWSITEDECLPGGNLFGVTILFICALIGGKLVSLIRLPRLPPFPPLLGKTPSFALYFKSLTYSIIMQKQADVAVLNSRLELHQWLK